jgi:hypothetical protein
MIKVIIILTIVSFICFYILKSINSRSKKGNLSPTSIIYLNGCLGYQSGVEVKIQANPDRIIIDGKYHIPIQKISEIKIVQTKQLTEQQKSVIGRSIIGILLAGGIGGIIGGISGIGATKKTEDVEILYITYKDINEIEQTMSFALMKLAEKSFFLNSWVYGVIERIPNKSILTVN